MRNFIFYLLLLLSSTPIFCQNNFIGAYDLDYPGMAFHNMLLVEDTIIIFGTAKHETENQWGLTFIQMDTLGNILNHISHFDNAGDYYMFSEYSEVIKTKDGGFILTGNYFFRRNPFLIKLDTHGDLMFVQEYPDEDVFAMRHYSIIEIAGGYISTGVKQQTDDYKFDAFIMKTDILGEKIWEKKYGEYDLYDGLYGIYKKNDNAILLTGGRSWTGQNVPSLFVAWWQPIALEIDTLGSIFWEWEGEQLTYDGSRSFGIQLNKDIDGGWVHGGSWGNVLDTLGGESIKNRPEIIKVDSSFNLVWVTRFGRANNSMDNYFVDTAPAPDGGWVAAGQLADVYDSSPSEGSAGWLLGGHLAKVNAQGDSLWSRIDTVFSSHPFDGSRSELNAVGILPSGSVIAVGTINRYDIDPSQSYGWIIKVDKDGCLIPNCNTLTDGVNLTSLLEGVSIYPNPTSDFIQVQYDGSFDLSLYDSRGNFLLEITDNYQTKLFSLSNYPKGVYFLKVQDERKSLVKKVIVH